MKIPTIENFQMLVKNNSLEAAEMTKYAKL